MNCKIAFVFCIIAGSVCAMKLSTELDNKDQSLTFKSLCGFPLASLSKGKNWFCSLTQQDKTDVINRIAKSDDKRLELLFNMATKLPFDLQQNIAQHLYFDKKIEFLHIPVYQAYRYEHFLSIIENEKNDIFIEICSKHPRFKPDIVCGLEKEIHALTDRISHALKKETIKDIAKLVETFDSSFVNPEKYVYYRFEKVLTFRESITESLRYLPLVLSFYIILALPMLDVCGVNKNAVQFNVEAKKINDQLAREYHATGSHTFLNARIALRDEHRYCISSFMYLKLLSLISWCVPLFDFYKWATVDDNLMIVLSNPEKIVFWYLKVLTYGITFHACGILGRKWQRPFLGIFYVTGLYFFMYLIHKRLCKKNDLKEAFVALNRIPELLQRTDINII